MSIRKVQCTNGHFFDGNKYELCPICQEPEKEEVAPKIVELRPKPEKQEKEEVAEKIGMFDFLHRKKKVDEINIPDDKTRGLDDIPQTQGGGVSPVDIEEKVEVEEQGNEEVITEPIKVEIKKETPPSLSKQVQEKANTIDAKTTGRYTTEETEPVVGWLVVINSTSQGLSFELNDGKNSIGRMRTNKVALENEPSVSREKHAYIIFDAKNNVFYIQSGETDKMTYLNDSPVLMPQQLNAYDKIQLGECELIFIPLCGDKFSWDNYIK